MNAIETNPVALAPSIALLFRVLAQDLLAAVLISVAAPSACEASDLAYTVEGRIRYQSAKPPGRIVLDENFTVAVSNCLWAITTFPDGPDPSVRKQVYDGKIVTAGTRFSRSKAHPAKPPENWLGNDSVLGIEVNDTPNPLSGTPGPLWLAYASGCKLANRTTGKLELTWFVSLELRARRFETPASWQIAPDPPYLPIQVDFFMDRASYETARRRDTPKIPGHVLTNALWTSYRATALTNIDGVLLPLTFETKGYEAADGAHRRLPLLVYRIHGTLLRAHQGVADHAFEHSSWGKTLVEDMRFNNWPKPVERVPYLVTNATILPVDDPQMLKAYARAAMTIRPVKSTPNRFSAWRTIGLVTISLIALLPFAVMLKRRGKTNEHTDSK